MPYDRVHHLAHEDRVERFDDFLGPHELAQVSALRAVERGTPQ
jgi:hypothetical protein